MLLMRYSAHEDIGRYPVEFPIKRTVVESGRDRLKVINEGETVRCWWCGERIVVNNESAFRKRGDGSKMEYVACPNCEKATSVLYLFDRKVAKGETNKKPCKRGNRRRDGLSVDSVCGD